MLGEILARVEDEDGRTAGGLKALPYWEAPARVVAVKRLRLASSRSWAAALSATDSSMQLQTKCPSS